MDLGVGEMGFICCGKHPVLVTRTQVSDPGPMDPLILSSVLQTSGRENVHKMRFCQCL